MSDLQARILPVEAVDAAMQRSMFALFEQYYADVSSERFGADLAAKDSVLVLEDARGAIRGFSTLAVDNTEFDGRPVRILYSGDTVVDRKYWGDPRFSFAWIEHAGRIKRAEPGVPLYWFLIVKGHRTYRYLPVYSREYFPHPARSTPPEIARLLEQVARRRFGERFDPSTGVISFPEPMGRLRGEIAAIDDRALRSEAVRYFVARNPGYARGDELACITELSLGNLRSLAARLFQRGLQA